MSSSFFLTPTAISSGLTSVSLGVFRALDNIGVRVGYFKPISQDSGVHDEHPAVDRSVYFIREIAQINTPDPISLKVARDLVSQDKTDLLMENIIGNFSPLKQQYDVIIIEGLTPDPEEPYIDRLNLEIAKNLNSDVILVAAPGQKTPEQLDEHLELAARFYASRSAPNVVGCILNKVNQPKDLNPKLSADFTEKDKEYAYPQDTVFTQDNGFHTNYARRCQIFSDGSFKLIGQIEWNAALIAPRTIDVVRQLSTGMLNRGEANTRRLMSVSVCARTVPNMISALRPGCLIVTPGDRVDVILAACMAALNGVPLAGLLLTGDYPPPKNIVALCKQAWQSGLPVLTTSQDTYDTAHAILNINREVAVDDLDRIEHVMTQVVDALDMEWFKQQCARERANRLSPAAFRYRLSEQARNAGKTIVLPEGNEPRTIQAAAICHKRQLARCVLLGDEADIRNVAQAQGTVLPPDIRIIHPDHVRQQYVAPMVELRKHKGVTPQMALAMLEDNVVLGTMMVALDEVDGLVSGAVHTTANTVRPALQIIKTHHDAKVVSSVFFMCLPEQVLVYGDCAINPDPTAEELADIAIQSAESALTFGIEPRIAMISYSTGQSGSGSDVDKVREATKLAQTKRPDLLIDGPLQYDAAAIKSVAQTKAPDSPVAGNATIFIFPDLNTGNTTYKAVQRSANVISIGPMLQGLRKPVNDLSRGALVEDIVFTIALTAVQAAQVEQNLATKTGS